MQALRTRPGTRRGGIVYLRTGDIYPNPVQPRKQFDSGALEELSLSIKNYGILNPLTVRCRGGRYELVAGERRLRAARLAGLDEVPCIMLAAARPRLHRGGHRDKPADTHVRHESGGGGAAAR